MQYRWIIVLASVWLCVQSTFANLNAPVRLRRQNTDSSSFPSLTTSNSVSATSNTPANSLAAAASSTSSSDESSSAAASSSSSSAAASSTIQSSAFRSSSLRTSTISSNTAVSSASATASPIDNNHTLPLQPKLTPALGIAGAVLILTGAAYTLVGIKNKWIQIFLSSAYLVCISVTVLIEYVMSPPVSDAIQGAYFVAIFMTGCIFGAGSLIFKEITEGLGCLLGGFCLGMWFLTLKSGGIITNSTGKGILLGVFMIVVWAFSFNSHTRAYGLIGSTSFAGATAFTLGIDCFTRAGLKEFWLYLWDLNSNLFPLNTNTYPITRGIRVEIAVIVLGCLIGVVSQLKLWKKIKARRDEKETVRLEEENRRDAVDEALGRHLERQNDHAKQQWEKLYGDPNRPPVSMGDSMIEQDEKRGRVSVISRRMHSGLNTRQVVEVQQSDPRGYSTNVKRQSAVTVSAIPEEGESPRTVLGDVIEADDANAIKRISDPISTMEPSLTMGSSIKDPITTTEASSIASTEHEAHQTPPKKRSSVQTFFKRISGSYPSSPNSSSKSPPSISQEGLVLPQFHHSRASSLAATIDEDHDQADPKTLSVYYGESNRPPAVFLSEALTGSERGKRGSYLEVPPSPPALSIDFDPEELTRPISPTADQEISKPTPSIKSELRDQSPRRYSNEEMNLPEGQPKSELTTGALENIPSQLSNVVLSYRTNEWAKHITIADAPEEPRGVVGDMKDELPTQVITNIDTPRSEPQSPPGRTPSESSSTIARTLSVATKPPKPHILPQRENTVKSNSSAESGTLQNQLRQNSSASDLPRMGPTSTRPGMTIGRALRSSSTPMLLGQSLVASPIDENAEVVFPMAIKSPTYPDASSAAILVNQRQILLRNRSSTTNQRSSSAVDLSMRSNSPISLINETPMRSNSRISLVNEIPMRSNSRLSLTSDNPGRTSAMSGRMTPQAGPVAVASRPDTRLSSYDSHQPRRQSIPTQEHRETLLANWRTSMRQGLAVDDHPEQTLGQRRADMLAAKQMGQQNAQQQQFVQMYKETAMDQAMRTRDMQQLHREAMRKMQAGANKQFIH